MLALLSIIKWTTMFFSSSYFLMYRLSVLAYILQFMSLKSSPHAYILLSLIVCPRPVNVEGRAPLYFDVTRLLTTRLNLSSADIKSVVIISPGLTLVLSHHLLLILFFLPQS